MQAERIYQQIKGFCFPLPFLFKIKTQDFPSWMLSRSFQKCSCVVRLFATHLYSKDNKQRRKSGAVKHLSRLKRPAFYPRAITITSGGRTIRHTVSADSGCGCFFFLLYCPLNVLNVLLYSFLHSLQLLYHERNVLHMHGETWGAMDSLPLALTLCCITW